MHVYIHQGVQHLNINMWQILSSSKGFRFDRDFSKVYQ